MVNKMPRKCEFNGNNNAGPGQTTERVVDCIERAAEQQHILLDRPPMNTEADITIMLYFNLNTRV